MFKDNHFQEQLTRLTAQDKENSRYDSEIPGWQVMMSLQKIALINKSYSLRYDPIAESGKSMGLSIMLDAHSDVLSTSSVLDSFMVISHCMQRIHDPYY